MWPLPKLVSRAFPPIPKVFLVLIPYTSITLQSLLYSFLASLHWLAALVTTCLLFFTTNDLSSISNRWAHIAYMPQHLAFYVQYSYDLLEWLMLKLKLYYLVTWCKQPTHWKSPWCWERLRAEGEESIRGWDGWKASVMQFTWTWANCGRWWGTGRPGVLKSMGSQRVRHKKAAKQQQLLGDSSMLWDQQFFSFITKFGNTLQFIYLLACWWMFGLFL